MRDTNRMSNDIARIFNVIVRERS